MRLIDLSLDQLTHFYVDFGTTLLLVLLLLLLLSFVSESVPRIYRERAIQKTYRAKNKKEPIQHKKRKEIQLREKNEQWNDRQKRERTCLLPDSGRNRFLRKDLSFTCPTYNRISESDRCALFNKDIIHLMEFRITLFHHTFAFSIHCVISLNLSNLMKCSIIFIPL